MEEVKEVHGHSDIAVTQRYAHLASDAIALATKATNGATAADATEATNGTAVSSDVPRVSEGATSTVSRPELANELARAKHAIANPAKRKRARQESNLRPTAPEGAKMGQQALATGRKITERFRSQNRIESIRPSLQQGLATVLLHRCCKP